MAADACLRVVGTIRTIELHTLAARFEHVPSRQIAKISLDVERAVDDEGEELDPLNLAELHFQGPAELVPRFSAGDRVQIVTSSDSSLQISSIRPAPLSRRRQRSRSCSPRPRRARNPRRSIKGTSRSARASRTT